MREIDCLPDWLMVGLSEEEDQPTEKQAGPRSLWQRVDAGDMSVLVRSAKKKRSIPIRRLV